MCPKCLDGGHLDWTLKQIQRLGQSCEKIELADCTPFTQEMAAALDALLEGVDVDDD
jgi:hypothetical protein